MRAKTDSFREIRFDQSRPGMFNLLVIYNNYINKYLLEGAEEVRHLAEKTLTDVKKIIGLG